MNNDTIKVFVYGTLKPGGRNYHRIAPFVLDAKPGAITGRMIDLGFFPGLIQGKGIVKGVVLTMLAESEDALQRKVNVQTDVVDRIEGYFPKDRKHNHYVRRPVLVNCEDGLELAQVYYYSGFDPNGEPLPKRDRRRHPLVVTGEENGLPVADWPIVRQSMAV